jgi:hypothetical protein
VGTLGHPIQPVTASKVRGLQAICHFIPPFPRQHDAGASLPPYISRPVMELNQAELRAHYEARRRGRCLADTDLITV